MNEGLPPKVLLQLFADTLKSIMPEKMKAGRKLFVQPTAAFDLPPEERDCLNVLGMKVLMRDYVPENELWVVDEKGDVLQKVICLAK